MNSCNFIGVVLKDPVTRRDKAGEVIVVTTYLNISVAREAKTKQRYDVLSLKATGTIAENIEKWIRKGNRIGVLAHCQFSRSVVSDSLRPHGLQHAKLPCPSSSPGVSQTHVH